MRTKLRGKVTLLFMMLGMLVALPAVAYAADGIVADGDTVTANYQQTLDLGTVGPGDTVTPDPKINFYLDCAGQNHFNSGEKATIAFNSAGSSIKDAANNPVTTSGSLSASSLTDIEGPTGWPADGTGCGGGSNPVADALLGSSTVTVVAPDDPGTYTYTVAYTVTRGTGTAPNELDTNVTNLPVTFTLTVEQTDDTPPEISYVLDPASPDGSNGWYKSNVTLTWTVTENESPDSLVKTGCVDQNITADQQETTYSCSASSDGGDAGPVDVKIKRDGTPPEITDDGRKTQPNSDGWYASEAFNKFSASDATSGLADSTKASFEVGTSTQEGSGLTVASGPVSDNAGNTAASVTSTATYNVDLSDPYDVAFVGGPAAGSSHDFGSVPAAPTCTADDDVSGIKSCVVTGHGTGVGSHTMTATATDKAGRTATATRTYTVKAATAYGFYQPVDMNDTLNTVKSGSTVPVKFELFGGASNIEQKSPNAVDSMTARKVSCAEFAGDPVDAIEYLAPTSENTGLRFDTTGDQFIYNWKTPAKSANTCYSLTMTAADNTTKLVAYFQLK